MSNIDKVVKALVEEHISLEWTEPNYDGAWYSEYHGLGFAITREAVDAMGTVFLYRLVIGKGQEDLVDSNFDSWSEAASYAEGFVEEYQAEQELPRGDSPKPEDFE